MHNPDEPHNDWSLESIAGLLIVTGVGATLGSLFGHLMFSGSLGMHGSDPYAVGTFTLFGAWIAFAFQRHRRRGNRTGEIPRAPSLAWHVGRFIGKLLWL